LCFFFDFFFPLVFFCYQQVGSGRLLSSRLITNFISREKPEWKKNLLLRTGRSSHFGQSCSSFGQPSFARKDIETTTLPDDMSTGTYQTVGSPIQASNQSFGCASFISEYVIVSPRHQDPTPEVAGTPSACLNFDDEARDHFSEPNTPSYDEAMSTAVPGPREIPSNSSPAKVTTRTFLRSLLSDQEYRLLAAEAEVELLRQQLFLEQQVATSMLVEAASKQQQLAHAPS
jgi:hypothetical protein